MSADLASFLLARISDDEVNAREIAHYASGAGVKPGVPGYQHFWWSDVRPEIEEFANPRRVLAECASKRQIVGLHGAVSDEVGALFCGTCRDDRSPYGVEWPCTTLRLLALTYVDHPDYRQG